MTTTGRVLPTKVDFRRYAMLGYVSIALVFGGFGLWASMAPLDRAAVAPGPGRRGKRSQGRAASGRRHRPGDPRQGDPAGQGRATCCSDCSRPRPRPTPIFSASRSMRRLPRKPASSPNSPTPQPSRFPPACWHARNVPETATAIADQQRQFVERRNSLASQVNILNSQIAQQQQELAGRDRQREFAGRAAQELRRPDEYRAAVARKGPLRPQQIPRDRARSGQGRQASSAQAEADVARFDATDRAKPVTDRSGAGRSTKPRFRSNWTRRAASSPSCAKSS